MRLLRDGGQSISKRMGNYGGRVFWIRTVVHGVGRVKVVLFLCLVIADGVPRESVEHLPSEERDHHASKSPA